MTERFAALPMSQFWPIATDRILTADRRFRGKADFY